MVPDVGAAFVDLREAVLAAGPLGERVVELVVLGSLVAVGQLRSVEIHVRRALAAGASIDEVKHAIVSPLASAGSVRNVVDALEVVESVADAMRC